MLNDLLSYGFHLEAGATIRWWLTSFFLTYIYTFTVCQRDYASDLSSAHKYWRRYIQYITFDKRTYVYKTFLGWSGWLQGWSHMNVCHRYFISATKDDVHRTANISLWIDKIRTWTSSTSSDYLEFKCWDTLKSSFELKLNMCLHWISFPCVIFTNSNVILITIDRKVFVGLGSYKNTNICISFVCWV